MVPEVTLWLYILSSKKWDNGGNILTVLLMAHINHLLLQEVMYKDHLIRCQLHSMITYWKEDLFPGQKSAPLFGPIIP